MLTYGLAYLAGTVAILSPCVLPLLPLIVGAALDQHRLGPAALAAGVALSFAAVGVSISLLGLALGIDAALVRQGGALAMVVLGGIMLSARVQMQLGTTIGGFTAPLSEVAHRMAPTGPLGQFGLGALLGTVWAPCAGPILGGAIALAARGNTALFAASVMVVFALGSVSPILILAYSARGMMMRRKDRLAGMFAGGKYAISIMLIAFGLFVLSGLDRTVEARAVEWMPEWWLDLITSL